MQTVGRNPRFRGMVLVSGPSGHLFRQNAAKQHDHNAPVCFSVHNASNGGNYVGQEATNPDESHTSVRESGNGDGQRRTASSAL